MSDIAVIGIGLRFPGKARSPSDLWDVLEGGEIQWSEIPKDRMNVDGYYHPSGDRQGTVSFFRSVSSRRFLTSSQISFRGAHFIDGDITAFDTHVRSALYEDDLVVDLRLSSSLSQPKMPKPSIHSNACSLKYHTKPWKMASPTTHASDFVANNNDSRDSKGRH